MKTFINDDYLIADDALLLYSGKDSVVDIPETFGDNIYITKIRNGALSGKRIKHIIIPDGIKVISPNAFGNLPNLETVELPGTATEGVRMNFDQAQWLKNIIIRDVEFTQSEYIKLKSKSLKTAGDTYIAKEIPDYIKAIINSRYFHPASRIPDGVPGLFCCRNEEKNLWLFSDTRYISFTGNEMALKEEDAFFCMIQSGNPNVVSNEEMVKNDAAVKAGNTMSAPMVYLFSFDDKKTRINGEKVYITVEHRANFYFFQTPTKVHCDKKEYYIYSRYYLFSDSQMSEFKSGLLREDVAVYSDGKRIRDRREVQRVYAKYRLMQIL